MDFDNPRFRMKAGQIREANRLASLARRERLAEIFAEIEARKNPQLGPGPDEEQLDIAATA